SIVVLGLRRVERRQVLEQSGLAPGRTVGYRDIQRATQALYATGQYDDVRVEQAEQGGRQLLIVRVRERPILIKWALRGVSRVEGNTHIPDADLVGRMKTGPEGFWWFRSGDYDDDKLRADLQEHLPKFYGDRGYVDFQVLGDTLVVDDTTGKATLVVRVSEGDPYRVGTFEIVGNRRFSTEDLEQLFPFKGEARTGLLGLGGVQHGPAYFNQQKWEDATQQLRTLYYNNGYIYMQPRADVIRRTGADGKPVVDLRWVITEGQPAIVNKVEIAGNDVSHERVIREAI